MMSSLLSKISKAALVRYALGGVLAASAVSANANTGPVGYVAGELNVSNGAANYSIPVAVPPGVAGMEPTLSLDYSSQGGPGLMGYGWNVGGVSAIQRCGSTLLQDGKNEKVKYTTADNYCLDGQRLIAVSGVNGGNGTVYRTELDGFSKVVSYGTAGAGPAQFKVWTKSGQIIEYGYTGDSRIEAVGKGSTVMVWAVNKISDTLANGSTINFSYNEQTAHTEFTPKKISYGPNGNVSVQFSYEAAANQQLETVDGVKFKTTQRLKHISTYVGSGLVQKWHFAYQTATDKPTKLTQAKVCASDGKCLQPTNFSWSEITPSTSGIPFTRHKDFDRNGQLDSVRADLNGHLYVSLNGGSEQSWANGIKLAQYRYSEEYGDGLIRWRTEDRVPTLTVADFNGDQRADIYTSMGQVFVSTGSGFSLKSNVTLPVYSGTVDGNYATFTSGVTLGDVNGDGYDDLIATDTPDIKVALASSAGTIGGWQNWGAHYSECNNALPEYRSCWQVAGTVTDLNGDGKADLSSSKGIQISNGTGFEKYASLSAFYAANPQGKLPVITKVSNNTNTTISYGLSTSSSVHSAPSTSYPYQPLRGGLHLVKTVYTDNGIGGTRTTQYTYGGAKVHAINGYLGFQWIKELDTATNTEVKTIFSQGEEHPRLVSMVKQVDTRVGGHLTSRSITDYTVRETPANAGKTLYFPHVTTSREYSYLGDSSNTVVTTVKTENGAFDAYGNLQQVTVTTIGGGETFKTITNSSYTNNASQWHLGRLTQSTVTHQAPGTSDITRKSSFTYDATTGLLDSETIEQGTAAELTTHYTYDQWGNKTQVDVTSPQVASTLSSGETLPSQTRTTTTVYDSNGQFPLQTINTLGHSDNKTFDNRYGVVTQHTGPNGLTTRWTYDSFGNVISQETADGSITTTTRLWAENGNCEGTGQGISSAYCVKTESQNKDGVKLPAAWVHFDSLNREVRKAGTGFDGRLVFTDTVYNSRGQVEKVSRNYYQGEQQYWAVSTYDAQGRVIRATQPGVNGIDHVIRKEYAGLETRSYNGKGQLRTTQVNALGKVVRVDEPEGAYMTYRYDALGHLTHTTDAHNNVVEIRYDTRGNKVYMNDPDMGIWQYDYTAFGELWHQKDAKGQLITMAYDKLGRMISRTEPGKTGGQDHTEWTYDNPNQGIGKLDQVITNGNTNGDQFDYKENVSYDSLGRATRVDTALESGSAQYALKTAYDSFGRAYKVTRPHGDSEFIVNNHYDANGFMTGVSSPINNRLAVPAETIAALQTQLDGAVDKTQTLIELAEQSYADAQRYFAKADAYAQNLKSAPTVSYGSTAPALGIRSGQSYGLYTYGGNTYIRQVDPNLRSGKFTFIHGDILIPVELPVFRYSRVNGSTLTEVGTSINMTALDAGASATGQSVYFRDYSGNGQLQMVTLTNNLGLDAEMLALIADLDSAADQLTSNGDMLLDIADKITLVAEIQYREALLAGWWAPETSDDYVQAWNNLITQQDQVYFWQAREMDAEGRISRELYGNGLHNVYNYDPANGLLLTQQTGYFNFDKLRDLSYEYDQLSNVTRRADLVQNVEERFEYDNLDRLKRSQVTNLTSGVAQTAITYQYDRLGNITYKSDVGTYIYGAKPHAVASAGNKNYHYDANGNMTDGDGRHIDYTAFNKPWQIQKDGKTVTFDYAPGRNRYQKVDSNGTTHYLGKVYERTVDGLKQTHKQFIYAGGSLVATHTSSTDELGEALPDKTLYMHKDNLGSVDTVTDAGGQVVQRNSFDPFGSRRPGNWEGDISAVNITALVTNRGFTGHEHLDDVGLIHMNGRVYDPIIGRFLSADPHVQSPYNTQSYNRYSYVQNNPLKYTDPSGYFFKKLFRAVKKVFKNKIFRMVAAIVVAYFTGGALANSIFVSSASAAAAAGTLTAASAASMWTTASIIGGAVGGFVGGMIASGGNIKAGLIGAFTGGAAGYIGASGSFGKIGKITGERIAAHGFVGGITSKAQGGKFGQGFMSSAFAKWASGKIHSIAGDKHIGKIGGAVAAGVVGGTVSVIGGGRFGNGARTAAFQYLFNEARTSSWEQIKKNFRIIREQLPKWWLSKETLHLRNGLQATIDVATIPYKTVARASNFHSLIEASYAYKTGNNADAALKLTTMVAGEGVARYLKVINVKNGYLRNAAGLGASKYSEYMLKEDCAECAVR